MLLVSTSVIALLLDERTVQRLPWNAGQNIWPKRPLEPGDIWASRLYLDEHRRLRGCGLEKIKSVMSPVRRTSAKGSTVIQRKTGRPLQLDRFSVGVPKEPVSASPVRWRLGD
jgi:hypothetical protein